MRLLALVLAVGALPMLLVHLLVSRLLDEWSRASDSWIDRWLSPLVVLRGEAVYWALVSLGWALWRPWPAKLAVVTFASLHGVAWAGAEFGGYGVGSADSDDGPRRVTKMAVVTFDLVEAVFLVWIGWTAANALLVPSPLS